MSAQRTFCQNFFSSPLYVHEFFFGTMVFCKNFFLMHMHLQDIFFSKSPPPPPPQKLNGRPLTWFCGNRLFLPVNAGFVVVAGCFLLPCNCLVPVFIFYVQIFCRFGFFVSHLHPIWHPFKASVFSQTTLQTNFETMAIKHVIA